MKRLFSPVVLLFSLLLSVNAFAASLVYDSYLDDVFHGNIATTDTYKCALVTSSYTASKTAHTKFSDVTNEVTGTGYSAGGATVVPTFTKDTTNHREVVTFPQLTWTSSTITARAAVCYKVGGTSATSPLVFYDDFGSDVSTTNGTFTLQQSVINFGIP